MPDYRSGSVRGGQQFAGVSRFLNLKRVFDDAKRQQQWQLQNDAMQQMGQRTQQATSMAQSGTLPGSDLNQFVDTGKFPDNFESSGGDNVPYTRWSPEKRLEYREQTKEQDRVFAAKKSLDTYLSDANQITIALNKIEKSSKELGDFKRGPVQQTLAKGAVAYGKYTKDEKMTRYQGVIAQELIPLARKLMEEKGPITEWDVSRLEKGLGDATTPLSDKLFLINEMRNKVKEAIKAKRRIASAPEGQGHQDDFSQMSDEELRSIANGNR